MPKADILLKIMVSSLNKLNTVENFKRRSFLELEEEGEEEEEKEKEEEEGEGVEHG